MNRGVTNISPEKVQSFELGFTCHNRRGINVPYDARNLITLWGSMQLPNDGELRPSCDNNFITYFILPVQQ